VKFVAVGNHAILDRQRRRNAIALGRRWLGLCGFRQSWGEANDTDICVGSLPQVAIVLANIRIPLDKVLQRDFIII
jgi:hypothetical protein